MTPYRDPAPMPRCERRRVLASVRVLARRAGAHGRAAAGLGVGTLGMTLWTCVAWSFDGLGAVWWFAVSALWGFAAVTRWTLAVEHADAAEIQRRAAERVECRCPRCQQQRG